MQETQEIQVPSLGWEDPPEEGMATHSSVLAWRIPWTEGTSGLVFLLGEFHRPRNLAGYSLWGCKESNTIEPLSTHT